LAEPSLSFPCINGVEQRVPIGADLLGIRLAFVLALGQTVVIEASAITIQ
jgi:hypothetical protein